MEMIERFMAVLFRIAGLKAVRAYDDVLALIDAYLRDLFAQSGREYEPALLREFLADSVDEEMRVRVLELLREKVAVLFAMGQREQATATLDILLSVLREQTGENIDRERRQKILNDLSREIPVSALDTQTFSRLVSVLASYGLYARVDDIAFSYPALQNDRATRTTVLQMYENMLLCDERELQSGNFSRQEVEESMGELRGLTGHQT